MNLKGNNVVYESLLQYRMGHSSARNKKTAVDAEMGFRPVINWFGVCQLAFSHPGFQ